MADQWLDKPPDKPTPPADQGGGFWSGVGEEALGFGKGVVKGVGQDVLGASQVASWAVPDAVSNYIGQSGPAQAFKGFVNAPAATWGETAGEYAGNIIPMIPMGELGLTGEALAEFAPSLARLAKTAIGRATAGAGGAAAAGGLQPTETGSLAEHAQNALYGGLEGGALRGLGLLKSAAAASPRLMHFIKTMTDAGVSHGVTGMVIHSLSGIPGFWAWAMGHHMAKELGWGKKAGQAVGKVMGEEQPDKLPKPMYSRGDFAPKDLPGARYERGKGVVPSPGQEFGRDPKFESGKGFEKKGAGEFRPVTPPPPKPGRRIPSKASSVMIGRAQRGEQDPGWMDKPPGAPPAPKKPTSSAPKASPLTVPRTGLKVLPSGKGSTWTPDDPKYAPQPDLWRKAD